MSRDHARPRKPLDEASLERLAMHYVARYATTESKLRDYLLRKCHQRGGEDAEAVLPVIVAKMVALGFVNDEAYAEMRTGSLLRRGYGARRIGGALRQAGIAPAMCDEMIESAPITPLEAAHSYAKRRKIGPYSHCAPTRETHQRAVARRP